jgi:hypothetical protein
MEVHHHTNTARKKWTHYFWEFLMLFLAVTLGFFVENMREHMIEHQREKQYARQLLSDLRNDSMFFEKRIARLHDVIALHNSFRDMMSAPTPPDNYELLTSGLPLLYTFDVQATIATYSQMKSSGTLRYIRDTSLIAKLQRYYEILLPRAYRQAEDNLAYYNNFITPFLHKHIRVQDMDYMYDSVITRNPIMRNRTADTDQLLLNILEFYKINHLVQVNRMLIPASISGNELIQLIKRKYHLK